MNQSEVPAPEVVAASGYPLYYSTYLHGTAQVLRMATAWYTGTGKLFSKHGSVETPGLGEGHVKYSVCMPTEDEQNLGPLPLVFVIEGGGFVLGQPSDGERHDRFLCEKLHAVVLSMDYAKSPRYPYPHALLQLYGVLKWCLSASAAEELGVSIDPSRVAIMGNSAGGNLTAALSLLTAFAEGPCARYRKELPKEYCQIAQILLYPSVACNELYRSRFAKTDSEAQAESLPVWVAEMMEASYMPPLVNKKQIFIAPLLATPQLLSEMRPNIAAVSCYVAGLDCLKNEAIQYCQKLEEAGVKVQLKSYARAIHGFSHCPENSEKFRKDDFKDCWDSISHVLERAFRVDKD